MLFYFLYFLYKCALFYKKTIKSFHKSIDFEKKDIIFRTMKAIFQYQDYRLYIQEFYTEQKEKSGLSWRIFAKDAGYSSSAYLKLVCDGKTRLTAEGAKKTALAMKLNDFETQYFMLMVEYGNAKNFEAKKKAFEEMIALGKAQKTSILGADFYTYFESWKNPVIRELAPAMPHAKPSELAEQCLPEISAAQVVETLDFLTKRGLLIKDKEGLFHQTDKSVSTGPMDVVPEAVRSMHKQMGDFAMKALEELPISERSFSGITMGIAKKNYERILAEIVDFRRRIAAIISENDETEQIYRLNLQFFPLTKNIKETFNK